MTVEERKAAWVAFYAAEGAITLRFDQSVRAIQRAAEKELRVLHAAADSVTWEAMTAREDEIRAREKADGNAALIERDRALAAAVAARGDA